MDADRTSRVYELFFAAAELPLDQRSDFLHRVCDDDVVRAEVRSLLEADANTDAFLSSPLQSAEVIETAPLSDMMIGRRIRGYTIRRLIGSGGMGVVYEADQEQPRRTVALKLMRVGFAGTHRAARLVREADVLARLQHPGIAQIYEAGVHYEAGVAVPYFAMEYVAGAQDIVTHARCHYLAHRDRLDLLARVCDAVAHGHQRGVIHRDLKPGNVLVDSAGQPKVIDFGVARLTDAESGGATLCTETGEIVGTLRYMSPEQCHWAGREVDTRTDVYALGVILYELMTGVFPYDLETPSSFEVPRIIRETEPRRPGSIDRTLRGDIETIVMKALAKDRDRRYASVGDLARDIRRFINNEPIDARRDSGWYIVRKTLRRHWIAAAVVALIVVICAASAVSLGVLYGWAESERGKTAQALVVAEQRGYFNSIALAHAALKEGETRQLLRYLEACPAPLRHWEWHYLRRLADTSLRTFRGGMGCAFLAEGSQILSYSETGDVRILDATSGEVLQSFRCDHRVLRAAAISPDGRLLVTAGDDCMIRFWSTSTGALIAAVRGDGIRVGSVVFSPGGQTVLTGGSDPGVKLWSVASREQLSTIAADLQAVGAAFSPDGSTLACATDNGELLLWDLASQALIRSQHAHDGPMLLPLFSSDGTLIVTAAWDTRVRVWRVDTGELLRTIECGTHIPRGIALSPDNSRLTVAAQALRVWDLRSGNEEPKHLGHDGPPETVAFSPDGRTIATGGTDGTIRLWDAAPTEEPALLRGHTDYVRAVAVFPDGRRIASTGRDGTIRIWDAVSQQELTHLEGHGLVDQELALSRDGQILVSGGLDGRVRIHHRERPAGDLVIESAHQHVTGVAISPDGREIASVGTDGVCRFWDVANGARRAEIDFDAGRLWHVAYSNNGSLLLVCGDDRIVHVIDRNNLRELRALSGHEDYVVHAVFSPDDHRIASGGADRTVRVWDAATGQLVRTLRGHGGVVQSLTFLPDGARLISGSYDHVINVWEPDSGTLVLTLRGHRGGVPWLAVSPDGSWFASASNDHTIGIWSSRPDRAE